MTETELREQLAISDRNAAELRKWVAETLKLQAEREKLLAESPKLQAEMRKLQRDTFVQGVLAATGLIGGILTLVTLALRLAGRLP